jgi:hypothetical protein
MCIAQSATFCRSLLAGLFARAQAHLLLLDVDNVEQGQGPGLERAADGKHIPSQ